MFLSRHLEPQSANEASKVLEQGLVQNKFADGKPRAMGLPTAKCTVFLSTEDLLSFLLSVVFTLYFTHGMRCGYTFCLVILVLLW